MSETEIHMNLVASVRARIIEHFLNGDSGLVLSDSPGQSSENKPPQIYGYVPDVFVPRIGNNVHFIIGEAKTARDLETRHSQVQIAAFLKRCNEERDSIFILAVPWDKVPSAKSLLKRIIKVNDLRNVNTLVLEKLRA